MNKILLLRLAGPMQSWGAASRFTLRGTEAFPTKSGIIGLLAAAQGRRRADTIEDLASLRMACRVDQPGELVSDFHTAQKGRQMMPLSTRYYLSDAVFCAFIEGSSELIDVLAEAIRRPAFPLYLGRRACPPTMPLLVDTFEGDMWEVITSLPWQAAHFHRRAHKHDECMSLRVIADAGIIPDQVVSERRLQDVPVSFDSERRRYGFRQVEETRVTVLNQEYVGASSVRGVLPLGENHDPMGVI